MVTLDINTPRGQEALADEVKAMSYYATLRGYAYEQTPKGQPAAVDGVLAQDGVIKALVEAKCRYNVSAEDFWGLWGGKWLVTTEKLIRGARLAGELCVPLVGFLYLVDAQLLLVRVLADSTGHFAVSFSNHLTSTQETCNGGTVVRPNSFIDMNGANNYPVPDA